MAFKPTPMIVKLTIVFVFLLGFLFTTINRGVKYWSIYDNTWDFIPNKADLENTQSISASAGRRTVFIEDLFSPQTKAAEFKMSPAFECGSSAFLTKVTDTLNNSTENTEGFSYQVRQQYRTMHYVASRQSVKTICETGFNFGHSSFNWLTANSQTVVHSFDLGNHKYAHVMSDYIVALFPGRFFIHFGNSMETIPAFIAANPIFRCDIMFVDGGHDYLVAKADIENFVSMARNDHSIIIFDDYPGKQSWSKGNNFGQAWEDSIKAGFLNEKLRCTDKKNERGFSMATVKVCVHFRPPYCSNIILLINFKHWNICYFVM